MTASGVRLRNSGEITTLEAVVLPARNKTPVGEGPSFVGSAVDLPALEWGLSRRLDFFRAACRLVIAMHECRMVHGNLWPGAIQLTNQLDPHLDPQAAAGEPAYIAPEIRSGALAVFASDVFGLGRLLWFVATDGAEIEPSSARLAPQTAGIAAVVRRACAVDADARHASVADLLAHLDAVLSNQAPQEDRPSTPDALSSRRRAQPQAKPPARRVAPIVLGIAALCAIVLAFVAGGTKTAPIWSAEVAAAIATVFGGMALLLRRQRPNVGA